MPIAEFNIFLLLLKPQLHVFMFGIVLDRLRLASFSSRKLFFFFSEFGLYSIVDFWICLFSAAYLLYIGIIS